MTRISDLPPADFAALQERLGGRTPAVFLDYDGTLTPIVEDPAKAVLTDAARAAVDELARRCPTAVVSGRDHDDVRALVGLDSVVYAGSHGFDISGPGGLRHQHPGGVAALGALDRAEQLLREGLAHVAGAWVERKRFAVAAHSRDVPEDRRNEVEDAARRAGDAHGLRVTGGKMIVELRPDVDWDKGRAVLWLLSTLGLDRDDVVPVYVGDDLTDEDAFAALRGRGVGLVVAGEVDHDTAADYRLADTGRTRTLLTELAAALSGKARRS